MQERDKSTITIPYCRTCGRINCDLDATGECHGCRARAAQKHVEAGRKNAD